MTLAFIAKTDLNTDGRILNQLNILDEYFKNYKVDFILLPDKQFRLSLPKARVHNISCVFRNSKFLRIFTVIEFTIKALINLAKISPNILHVHDSAVVLPAILYKRLINSNVIVIYDDHEIPNSFNVKGIRGINLKLEQILLRTANSVIFANYERLSFLKERLGLQNHLTYFLNLPYYDDLKKASLDNLPSEIGHKLSELDLSILNGTHYIMHQGVIKKERGEEKLAMFSKRLPRNFKIMIVGGNRTAFDNFLLKYKIDGSNFYFVGTVDYVYLSAFWKRCVASVIIYLPDFLNNKLCAPNRFYLSLEKRLPVIVNEDNPVLSNFVRDYKCGYFIENFKKSDMMALLDFDKAKLHFSYEKLRKEQIANFVSTYSRYLEDKI